METYIRFIVLIIGLATVLQRRNYWFAVSLLMFFIAVVTQFSFTPPYPLLRQLSVTFAFGILTIALIKE